ncbi:MAG TPA: SDR family oxidoreductase [Vicinamibacteria bacterium]|nr:SDR family oxidoreductase [Vicinamibacteria bacterium]
MARNDDVVVITGASSGIGAALARRLGGERRRLVLAARRGDRLREVAREAEQRGALHAAVVETDVTRRADVERLRDVALSTFGRFDAWVNNAGRGIARPVLELTEEDVDEMIAVNLKSALYGMQVSVPHFLARGSGHLVNVSSFLGRVPLVGIRSAYSAAKAALNSLTASLRLDLAAKYPGVQVSVVMPGIVSTDFARNARAAPPPGPTTARAAGPPQMQAQTPEEVAEAIARLLHHPLPELYTNPASAELARAYFADVAAFERRASAR